MTIRELLNNNDFDVNSDYIIYDCRNTNKTWHEADVLLDSFRNGRYITSDRILDMRIKYVTIDIEKGCLVVEADNDKKENHE